MRYIVVIIVLGVLCYLCYDYHYLIDQVMGSARLVGTFVDADNLEGKPVKPYAIPKGHCKAYFPGDPRTPPIGQELFSSFMYPSTNKMMADKKMNYYLSEVSIPSMGLASLDLSGANAALNGSKFTSLNLNGMRGGTSFSSVGNNEAVQANNFQSDLIKAQDSLNHFIDTWAKEKKATIESRMAASMNGGRFNGLEILGHLKEPVDRFDIRLFCDPKNKIVVIVGVVGQANRLAGRSAKNFLNSLEMWQ